MRSRVKIILLALLLLTAVVAPAAGGTYSGSWAGTTKQGEKITFKVNAKNNVTTLKAGYVIQGAGCSSEVVTTLKGLSAPIIDGKFTVTWNSGGNSLKVKGTMISSKKAKGTIKAHQSDPTGGYGCEGNAKTSWTANR